MLREFAMPQHGDEAVERTRRRAGHGPGVEDMVSASRSSLAPCAGGKAASYQATLTMMLDTWSMAP
jgi:hypothetical protein